ncbi:MAG TPA: pectate lyase [Chitinophagaceae bacterium]|nr:pectate lyase [Chitinophagaceae bacterium]
MRLQDCLLYLLPLLALQLTDVKCVRSIAPPEGNHTSPNTTRAGKNAVLAFPGAEGGGRFARGGRGGEVYEVTNLHDAGAGSLRDAVSRAGRTIVFRVSGIIHLKSTLKITHDDITIAGQTAPGDGICIAGYTLSLQASNLIVRYIRCRLGDENDDADDAMHATEHSLPYRYHDMIIDHCSMSWAVDEVGTFYGVRNFTLQWCILSESLYHSVHPKGDHGYGGIWGGYNASFHHNLIADNSSRNPRFCGSRYTGKPDSERVDFRNNVIYNWGNINSVYGGEGGNYNMVNNYYKPGPATPGSLTKSSASNKRNRILNYTSYYFAKDAAVYPDTVWGGKFYIAGNYVAGYPDVTVDNWTLGVQKDGYYRAGELIKAARQDKPFACAPVRTQTAGDAYKSVLDSAGAILPKRDAVDRRIVSDARKGVATDEGATYGKINKKGISHPSGIIDSQNDVGGYPAYHSSSASSDKDHDGMPDDWETGHHLDPNDATDRNAYTLDKSYTNLEVYLNGLTGIK